jgi:hypothetical protein
MSRLLAAIAVCAIAAGCGSSARDRKRTTKVDTGPKLSAEDIEKQLAALYAAEADRYHEYVSVARRHAGIAAKRNERAQKGYAEKIPLTIATGLVLDRTNTAVPGATVMITSSTTNDLIGEGRTDARGKFDVTLYTNAYRSLVLHVIAAGFEKWVRGEIHGGIVDYRVQLSREIDERFLKALIVESDPRIRLWMLLEIVGVREEPLDVKTVYRHIGDFRTELYRVLNTPGFHTNDSEEGSPAKRALQLLAFWQEPADTRVILEHLPRRGYILLKRSVITGPSPGQVCRRWANMHFAQQGLNPPPQASCGKPHYGPDRNRALLEFRVFEAYSSYSHLLSMIYNGREWDLKLVKEHKRW